MESELDVIKKYIEIGSYKGLDVAVGDGEPDEAVWSAVEKNFAVKEWPFSQVQYYRHQLEAEYKYLAEVKYGKSKSEVEIMLEDAAGRILDEAKSLTKSDLVYSAIVKLENISISESEKERLFDKYVEKYVSVYGYNTEYVKANMEDEIYASMLYDKTTEFLLTNNNIKEK
jgi:FKBP-type peptidyl-prolyl cis-trans isomerase (trigger factor)